MSLSPFGRRSGFYDAHSEVNRLLDEMFGGLGRRPAGRMAQATAEWAPSVDVLPKDGDLVVRAEMPGVKPEDVEVAVHNGVLTISGERKVDQEEERAGYYVRELRHGSFRRSMLLPEGVEEGAQACPDRDLRWPAGRNRRRGQREHPRRSAAGRPFTRTPAGDSTALALPRLL
jgi:HSP20 family protein